MKKTILVAGVMALGASALAQAAEKPASSEQMWEVIQRQQQQIEQLQKDLVTTREGLETTSEALERANPSTGLGFGDTKIGGYGELHYNGGDKDQIDFHRFVLFFNHTFSDDIRLFSELELEHSLAGDGKPGEVELEQAFVEFDLSEQHRAKAGLFLLPVGILNETHEPPTFYGVERNPVESNIIPTTWWEAGAGLSGQIAAGWGYDFALHSGLNVPTSNFAIRSGRQKVAEADAKAWASTGRVRWTGVPGLELGAALQYQHDLTQDNDAIENSATLAEIHAVWTRGPVGLRALYARWDIDGADFEAAGADEQIGWYVEPSYRITEKLGVFARYNVWNNRAGGSAEDREQTEVGVNFWPHRNVVLKADYQWQNDVAGDDDRVNLGVGYQF